MDELIDFPEGAVHDDGAGGLGRDIAVLAEGDPDGSSHEGGGVIDPVTDVDRAALRGFGAYDFELFLGTLSGLNIGDPDPGGEVISLGLAVS